MKNPLATINMVLLVFKGHCFRLTQSMNKEITFPSSSYFMFYLFVDKVNPFYVNICEEENKRTLTESNKE